MAVWALLGVKIIRCNTKHLVTLNANTVDGWLSQRWGFQLGCMRLGRVGTHAEIVAQHRATLNPRALGCVGEQHPGQSDEHLYQSGSELRQGSADFSFTAGNFVKLQFFDALREPLGAGIGWRRRSDEDCGSS